MKPGLQFDDAGRLRHLLTIEGLSRQTILEILDTAESFISVGEREIKKIPLLRGKTVVNLFFESSTRTRTTFEIAAKRLSADVINLNVGASSTSKGETLLDTLATLQAMQVDMFVIRHSASGAAHFFAQHAAPGVSVLNAGDGRHAHPTQALLDTIRNLEAMHTDLFVVRHAESGAAHLIARHVPAHVHIINAGDGRHAHPTQGLLDMFTIRRHKGSFEKLKVAIVGDILHSRVARSQIHALTTLGVKELRVVAPKTLLPTAVENLGVRPCTDMEEGLDGVDVVMMLRLQRERMQGALIPSEQEYFNLYGLTPAKLARAARDAIVMHPGPMNRGLEIDSAVADGAQSVILPQVTYGIAVRMAVMALIMGGSAEPAGGRR